MFQAFKELGNAVIFSLLLEKALGQQEVVDILQAAPFQNLYPKPYVKGNVKLELFVKKLHHVKDYAYTCMYKVQCVCVGKRKRE